MSVARRMYDTLRSIADSQEGVASGLAFQALLGIADEEVARMDWAAGLTDEQIAYLQKGLVLAMHAAEQFGAHADEASVFALGRGLVRRAKHDYPVELGGGIAPAGGKFPPVGGTKGRPALGHTAPVVLEVRQVPEELARRMAEKEPGRYRVVASGEARR